MDDAASIVVQTGTNSWAWLFTLLFLSLGCLNIAVGFDLEDASTIAVVTSLRSLGR